MKSRKLLDLMIRVAQAVCHHLVTRFPRLNLRISPVKKLFAFPFFYPVHVDHFLGVPRPMHANVGVHAGGEGTHAYTVTISDNDRMVFCSTR